MPHDTKAVSHISRVTWVGLLINAALSLTKIVAGTQGHSRAVVADGLHSLSDLVSDIAVLIGVRLWSAPADHKHPYGHQRFETVVTLIIGLDAFHTWQEGDMRQSGVLALIAALSSMVIKELCFAGP